MDKKYKPLFIRELKRRMALDFRNFIPRPVPADYPQRDIFGGAFLFASPLSNGMAVWLWWITCPGVERYFNIYLGWSSGLNIMPHSGKHESRLYALSGPSREIPAGAIALQQIQGESAVGGFTIPSPWDQVYAVKAMAPRREHVAAMENAALEDICTSDEQRHAAVAATLESVFATLHEVVPTFTRSLETVAGEA